MTQEEYLAHHGILGQKWGVRRYQNEDGTLTDLGKKRYAKDVSKFNKLNDKSDRAHEKAIKKQQNATKFHITKFPYQSARRATINDYKTNKKVVKAFIALEKRYSKEYLDSLDPEVVSRGQVKILELNSKLSSTSLAKINWAL